MATSLEKGKNQSAAIAGKIPKPGEINVENITRPKFEQLSAEDQKAIEDIRKKIREELEQEIRRQEEEKALKHYVSHFSVDRQGKVTKIRKSHSILHNLRQELMNSLLLIQKLQIW